MNLKIFSAAALLVMLAVPQMANAQQPGAQPAPGQGQQAPGRGQGGPPAGAPGAGVQGGRGGGRGQAAPPQLFTLAEAKAAVAAAEATMVANNWRMVIIVADAQGVPVLLSRNDGVGSRFYDFAMGKIKGVVATGLSSKEYADAVAAGTQTAVEGAAALDGAFPIKRNGQVIGVISASGASAAQDAVVSRAGLATFGAN